jgi:hypothetical protein
MPTTFNDQFYLMDPFAPPPVGTTLVPVRFDLVDQNDDGDVDRFNGDSIDGSDIQSSYPGDTVTVNLPRVRSPIPASPSTSPMGERCLPPRMAAFCRPVRFAGTSAVSGQGSLDTSGPDGGDLGPPCLTPGVLIDTAQGRIRSSG